MTNERFIYLLQGVTSRYMLIEHAKKLVSLVETAKRMQHYDCAVRGEDDCDLCKAIKDLERG